MSMVISPKFPYSGETETAVTAWAGSAGTAGLILLLCPNQTVRNHCSSVGLQWKGWVDGTLGEEVSWSGTSLSRIGCHPPLTRLGSVPLSPRTVILVLVALGCPGGAIPS